MFQVLLQTLRQSESMSNIIRTLRKIHELGSICSQKNLQECSLPKDPTKIDICNSLIGGTPKYFE